MGLDALHLLLGLCRLLGQELCRSSVIWVFSVNRSGLSPRTASGLHTRCPSFICVQPPPARPTCAQPPLASASPGASTARTLPRKGKRSPGGGPGRPWARIAIGDRRGRARPRFRYSRRTLGTSGRTGPPDGGCAQSPRVFSGRRRSQGPRLQPAHVRAWLSPSRPPSRACGKRSSRSLLPSAFSKTRLNVREFKVQAYCCSLASRI